MFVEMVFSRRFSPVLGSFDLIACLAIDIAYLEYSTWGRGRALQVIVTHYGLQQIVKMRDFFYISLLEQICTCWVKTA